MTEQQVNESMYIDQEFSWDAPLVTDAGGGRTHFATLRLYSPSVIPFQAGQHFTLPGVFDDKYDEASKLARREGQKHFNGMILGVTTKKHHYYVLVATKTDKSGAEYQVVKGYKSWQEKGRKNVWAELQFPALKELAPTTRELLIKNKPIYVSFEDVPTGETFTPTNGDKAHDINYWGNFTVYPTLEALKVAEKEHFAQFGASNGATPTFDTSNFPGSSEWASDDPATLAGNWQSIKDVIQGNGTNASTFVQTAAEDLYLINKRTGQPVKRLNGDAPVDLAQLFADALGIPVDDEMRQVFEVANIKKVLGIK